jgi:predicted RND superfamily exporter protein
MKKFLIGICAVIVIGTLGWSAYMVGGMTTEYSMDQFYPKEHDLLKGHDKIQHQFRLNAESPYLFVLQLPQKDSWLTPRNIKKLQDLSLEIQGRDDVSQIISITHVEGASSRAQELVIGNIFDREHPNLWKQAVIENPLLYPLLISPDFKSTLIAVEPGVKNKLEREKLEAELERMITESFPKAMLSSAGVPLLQTRLSNMIQGELGLFLVLISLAFCAIFSVLFTHWSAIACAFVMLVGTNIFALAVMSAFKIPMNVLLVTLPVIVSVSVMSLLIHTLHLWSQTQVTELNMMAKFHRSFQTLKEIGLPNALGIITTALGFLALAPSAIPLIGQYGWTVAMVLGFVTILSQLLMFLALPFVTPKMRGWFDKPAVWTLWATRHARKILFSTTAITVVGLFLISQLNFSTRLFDDLPEQNKVRKTMEWIDQDFGGILSYELSAHSDNLGFWRKPESLETMNTLASVLRTLPAVGTIVTAADFFQDGIPEKESEISETFFLFSMAERNPLNSFLTDDGKTLRLSIRLKDLPSAELDLTRIKIKEEALKLFPLLKFSEGGIAHYAHAINQEVASALIFDFWQPLVLIGLFLIFMFRSFKWAIVSCIPNLIPPAFLIAALAISQVQVKPGIALIFSIALGFAFNNTLYILTRLQKLTHQGKEDPLKHALLMEGNPCLFESVLMFIGFSIFLTSEFNMNQTFGGFMLISILAGFIADLIFLPAFLKAFPGLYQRPVRVPVLKEYGNLAAGLAVVVLASVSMNALAAPDAKEILKRSQALLDAKDDEASVEMKIIEANGETKSRMLDLKTLRENGFSVMARIQSPADIKDMAFLGNVDTDGNEMQWIYLPSNGQVRRLVTGKTKAGLLGSEISPEDLNSQAIKSAAVKLIKTDDKFHWIELIPSAGSSDYTKVVTKISITDNLPKFTAYYIDAKLKKTVAFKDYKKVGPIWRAHAMVVQNHLNKRGTEVKLSNIKVNRGLSSDDFSQSNLKEN